MGQEETNPQDDQQPFDICERTFQLALRMVRFCLELERTPGVPWVLSKQLLRSSTSIGANVEEGQAAQSRADFVSKYSIARKEARETNYWLRLIKATGIRDHDEIPLLLSETEQITRILTAIIMNAQGS